MRSKITICVNSVSLVIKLILLFTSNKNKLDKARL